MKEITAILIDYSEQATLYKAMTSLQTISSKLNSVIVLQNQNTSLHKLPDHWPFLTKTEIHSFQTKQMVKALNKAISKIKSEYVLFLHDSDYLVAAASTNSFEMNPAQAMIVQNYRIKNISIHLPLLVRTALLQEYPFPPDQQLPFKESLFPAWISGIDASLQHVQEGLVRKSKEKSTPDRVAKQRFAEKYQLQKVDTQHPNPSLSILIANYNMEKYVETAIASCLFQNEKANQICIMDDGSTDNSKERIQNWQRNPGVQIFHKKNEGKARALNDLLAEVTSDFILELDADDWLDPDAVSIIKKHLANAPEDVAVLYGNLRKWKQTADDVQYKKNAMGREVNGKKDLLSYSFPLGPRIYRTSSLKAIGGFPVIFFQQGRLYEDVSVLNRLITDYRFQYANFTVYNVREHKESITKNNLEHWNAFFKNL